ncbi:UTRA domain-containing protein [Streptomyces sp. NPDC006997]|uniref:UTRA domain-containing protein n=1 Tax=Streptomyces sp. NPDC006997 TaxID=3155356 RepID=UPI0033F30E6E
MAEAHGPAYDNGERRTRSIRDNRRHQWEKDRARQPEDQRRRTGATERETGLTSQDLVFHAAYRKVEADDDLADAFGVAPGTPLLERTHRTRCAVECSPLSLITSYLRHDLIAADPALLDAANEPWPGGTQSQLHTVGIELDRIEERLTARSPTPGETQRLRLPPGTPVITLRKISYDVQDRVVDVTDVTLPGDRVELRFTTPLERW